MSMNNNSSNWFGTDIEPGQSAALSVVLSENYSGEQVVAPVYVWRGKQEGPTVCITAAVHGDEINGTGAIRHIIRQRPFELVAGTLLLVPVVNMYGYERHTRYLPDRRDLNRSFPGSPTGSLASRLAWSFFSQVTKRCDFGIDLHTAAVRRTNFPNVRADMYNEKLADFARAFGAELTIHGQGPENSLRASACQAGCQTLILEAGEVWKVETGYMEYATRGIENCLKYLGMVEGKAVEPAYRIETDASKWIRAEHGGFLEFHVAPGDIIDQGDAIATNTDLLGDEKNVVYSSKGGVVLGMTTIPSVSPGDPICHIAFPRERELTKASLAVDTLRNDSLHERMRGDLAANVHVTEHSQGATPNQSD